MAATTAAETGKDSTFEAMSTEWTGKAGASPGTGSATKLTGPSGDPGLVWTCPLYSEGLA